MNPQINMQALQAEKQNLEATYFEQRLNAELFPAGKISDWWKKMVTKSIQKTSPLMMRISINEFVDVVQALPKLEKSNDISLFEFGVLSNSLECVSMDDLGLSPVKYVEFMGEVTELIGYYKKRVTVIREDVAKRAQDDIGRKAQSLASNGDKKAILKPVTGQA